MSTRTPSVVAIVDDDPSVLEALGNLLESAGYTTVRFDSAENFLRASLAVVNCLISDIGMPKMSGLALQALVGRERPDLPVILITGRDDPSDAGLLAVNNRGFFRKPCNSQQLLDAVAGAVGPASGP